MSRVFIAGSSTGLGLMAGQLLIEQGHDVQAHLTQVWLAVGDDAAGVSGQYFYHRCTRETHPAATSTAVQDGLLAACVHLSGVELPAAS
ncbi:MAG TPA: hypothetical protein VLR26_03035 [Frankiaceae bacterium]|nr:hypothetical protein [Frankiaceae bacterium]